jgi:hypothetical protein
MRPGLGKTAVVCVVRVILKKKKLGHRMLVIAPLSVADMVWKEEIAKWDFPLKIGFAHGKKFEDTIRDTSLDIVTMTCDGPTRLLQSFTPNDIAKLFDHLCIDESIKFARTSIQRFKALRPFLPSFGRRTILTGGPAPNGYENLFGQVFIVDQGARLGRYITRYRMEYFHSTGFGGYTYVLQNGADKRVQQKLSDILYFVDDAALGLDPYRINAIKVKLPPKADAAYHEMKKESLLEHKDAVFTAVNGAVLSGKLRQMSSGALYTEGRQAVTIHTAKLDALEELIEQLQSNPLLLAYEWDHERDRIRAAYGKTVGDMVIDGGTSLARRREILAEFNTGNHPVLLAQGATIAHGLNLQAACHTVAWFTPPWDLDVWDQFIKRVHRLGQEKRVMVHVLLAAGTMDEGVLQVLKGKDRTQRGLLKALTQHVLA